MNTIISNIKVHDILEVRIERSPHMIRDRISNPDTNYQYFLTDRPGQPGLTVTIGDFTPDILGCDLVDGKYHIRNDYIYFRDAYKIARWEAEISGFENGPVAIRLNCNTFGLIYAMVLIEFFMRYLLVQKGYALIHSFGIVQNGHGYLFPARSGVGKTVTSTYFLSEGYRLLSDNFIIVKDTNMFSFPTPMLIFSYNVTGPLKKRIPGRQRLGIFYKNLLYRATAGYAKFLTPVQIQNVFPGQIQDRSPIRDIIITVAGDTYKTEQNIDKNRLPALLCAINKFETTYYLKMIESYRLLFPQSGLSTHWDRLTTVLENTVSWLPCHLLQVPTTYGFDTYVRIKNFMRSLQD